MIELFRNNGEWTEEAITLSSKVQNAIDAIIAEYAGQVDIRHLEYVISNSALSSGVLFALQRGRPKKQEQV